MISILLLGLVAVALAITDLWSFGQLRWSHDNDSFWGQNSGLRKYKMPLEEAPNTWYYRVNKVVYKERFPGSATVFVAFTDGYHLTQFIMTKLLFAAITTSLWGFLFIWAVWSLFWWVSLTMFKR